MQYYSFTRVITPTVKKLIILNVIIFMLQIFLPEFSLYNFGLSYITFIQQFKFWQILTYMFMHGGILHLFFNMFILWMVGCELEEVLGSKNFLKYYLYSGIGAGIFITLLNIYTFNTYGTNPFTIGASGAIYALLLAYALFWPDRYIYVYFIFPFQMKYFLLVLGAIEFIGTLSSLKGAGSSISHIGHLGGILSGYLILKFKLLTGPTKKLTLFGNINFFSRIIKNYKLKKHKKRIENRMKAKEIIDKTLYKISTYGYSSLTKEEKKLLEWARRNYYPDDFDTIH